VDGTLTSGHARALLAIPSVDGQLAAGKKVIAQGLSVRETEKLAMPPDAKPKKTPEAKDPNVEQIEEELRRLLGTKVSLRTAKRNRGKIEIEYYSFDDLDRILGVVRSSR
jgi:ParB family chromosome partitioning protein